MSQLSNQGIKGIPADIIFPKFLSSHSSMLMQSDSADPEMSKQL